MVMQAADEDDFLDSVIAEYADESDEENESSIGDDNGDSSDWSPQQIEFAEDWMITSFFFSIPCWTHTFQLLFGDMQKRNCIVRDAFLITQQVAAQMTRTVTAKLRGTSSSSRQRTDMSSRTKTLVLA